MRQKKEEKPGRVPTAADVGKKVLVPGHDRAFVATILRVHGPGMFLLAEDGSHWTWPLHEATLVEEAAPSSLAEVPEDCGCDFCQQQRKPHTLSNELDAWWLSKTDDEKADIINANVSIAPIKAQKTSERIQELMQKYENEPAVWRRIRGIEDYLDEHSELFNGSNISKQAEKGK